MWGPVLNLGTASQEIISGSKVNGHLPVATFLINVIGIKDHSLILLDFGYKGFLRTTASFSLIQFFHRY